ncbi:hypothetical protein ABOONEI_2819 [Aciduliprofundum boonei T469]|nr:hypothetical protein ABOONEI_2819 [Aciduliprofundum boonei T469]
MSEERKEVDDDEKDIEEFKEVMNTLRDFIPAMIREIVEALYSGQSAEEFGKQVANFYKSLVDAGMNNEQAFTLTQKFMESRDVVGILKKILSEGNWGKWKNENVNPEEIAEQVMKEVNEELKKEKEN